MPRKTRRVPPAPARQPTPWAGYALTAVASLFVGAGSAYAVLRQPLAQSQQPAQSLPTVAPNEALVDGNKAFDRKDWSQAVTDYNQAIAGGADNPDVRTDLGTAYRGLHQYQQALDEYSAAQRQDPQHENSLLNQGIVYAFDLHDTTHATAIWQQYLQRFPHGQHVADVKHFLTVGTAFPAASAKP